VLEREAAFVVPEDVLVTALAAHPHAIADFFVRLEGAKIRVGMLVDHGRRCWWLYRDVGVVVLSNALRAGVR
jgi:hypothetical protein